VHRELGLCQPGGPAARVAAAVPQVARRDDGDVCRSARGAGFHVEIARRCSFRPRKHKPILPPFDTKRGRNESAELAAQAEAGLKERLKIVQPAAELSVYKERLEYEIGIIERMGFPGYFLIVSDFIKWAKANDIPVGPGRGSGAGSLVAWVLTITDLDPIRFGLLFERFLNPSGSRCPTSTSTSARSGAAR
jgi:DNA polymerase-3 subunit alpha